MAPAPTRRHPAALALAFALTLSAAIGFAGVSNALASIDTNARVTRSAVSADAKKDKARVQKVKVKMFRFQTETLEVLAGTKVVWKNRDQILHTVTSVDDPSSDVEPIIDGMLDGVGAKVKVTFTEPGTYAYFCMVHPVMQGRVVVTG